MVPGIYLPIFAGRISEIGNEFIGIFEIIYHVFVALLVEDELLAALVV